MAGISGTELFPKGPPQNQEEPSGWPQNPCQILGSLEKKRISAGLDVIGTGQEEAEQTWSIINEKQRVSKKTDKMTGFMDDLALSASKERSCSSSRSVSSKKQSSSVSSSDSSYSSESDSSISSSSTSWSRSRSRSRSCGKRNCSQRYRQNSRSYSRSRSRSHNYNYRERHRSSYYRKYRCSPPRYRSPIRPPVRSCYRRPYFRNGSRNQRHYGFGRTICPEVQRSRRNNPRTRSRSRTPLRLTEKEKKELLEIAKANAAKTLGKEIVLPASLGMDTKSREDENLKENNLDYKQSSKQTNNDNKGTEITPTRKGVPFHRNIIMPRPLALKSTSLLSKDGVVSSGKKETPVGQWIPVQNGENVLLHYFSSKTTTIRTC